MFPSRHRQCRRAQTSSTSRSCIWLRPAAPVLVTGDADLVALARQTRFRIVTPDVFLGGLDLPALA
jgi:hypothetical protein